jgi:hypothetical protein
MVNRRTHLLFLFPPPFPFRVQEFNWTGLWATKQGKIVRSFVPTSFDEYRWEFLSNWKRFVSVLLLCIAVRSPTFNTARAALLFISYRLH